MSEAAKPIPLFGYTFGNPDDQRYVGMGISEDSQALCLQFKRRVSEDQRPSFSEGIVEGQRITEIKISVEAFEVLMKIYQENYGFKSIYHRKKPVGILSQENMLRDIEGTEVGFTCIVATDDECLKNYKSQPTEKTITYELPQDPESIEARAVASAHEFFSKMGYHRYEKLINPSTEDIQAVLFRKEPLTGCPPEFLNMVLVIVYNSSKPMPRLIQGISGATRTRGLGLVIITNQVPPKLYQNRDMLICYKPKTEKG